MGKVTLETRDRVAVLMLNHGITHALDLGLLEALSGHLGHLAADPDVGAVVLTGAGAKFFSIGFDLPALVPLDREEFGRFYRAFNRVTSELLVFPAPTVAAIRGHAVAGGCILALACDRRVIAQERTLMGLNEIKLGVPIPYPGECILRNTVGPGTARTIVESGDFHEPSRLLAMGMVDSVVPRDEVLETAIAQAREHARFPKEAARQIKRSRTERVEREIRAELEIRERAYLDCWFAEDARRLLTEATRTFHSPTGRGGPGRHES